MHDKLQQDHSSTNKHCTCDIGSKLENPEVEGRHTEYNCGGFAGRSGARARATASATTTGRRARNRASPCRARLAYNGLATGGKLRGDLLSSPRKLARACVLGVCGSLVQVVLVEGIRESFAVAAPRECAVHTGSAVGKDTTAIVALCGITDVVELSCYTIFTEARFGNTSKILDHTLANGVVGSWR